jgi:outer membrane receptor protein involved in Fe transport
MIRHALAWVVAVAGSSTTQATADPELQEIIVTGERWPRRLSETASSVSVISADAVEALAGADRTDQLLALMPNVQFGSGTEGPTIRGQDSTGVLRDLPGFLGGARPRATLQVDGRAVSFNEFVFGTTPVWDIDRVEVFRSPQSTTQGRNSIGGAIFVQTLDPAYEPEFRARVLAGSDDLRQVSLAASAPVIDEQLAFRIAGDLRRGHPNSDIGDVFEGADPNRDDFALLRAKLLVEPAAVAGLRLLATYSHVESAAPQIEGVSPPFEERSNPSPFYGVFENDVDSLTVALDYAFRPALASRTTFSLGDVFTQRFARPGLGETKTHSRDVSVESVLQYRPEGRFQLSGGVHYLDVDLDQDIDLTAVLGSGGFTDRQHSVGLFGEAQWQLSPFALVTAGLRYQRDDQTRSGTLGSPGLSLPVDFDGSFDALLPKVSMTFRVRDGLSVGALVQRAYNPGGVYLDFDTLTQQTFDAESLWNYELFARARTPDGRLDLSANLFFSAGTDSQRAETRAYTVPGGGTAFWAEIRNVPATEAYGLEAELTWSVHPALQVRAGLGLLETRITRTESPADPLAGNSFQRAPAMTAMAAVDWQPRKGWRLSAQGRLNTDYFSDDANTPARRIDGAAVLDARASYTWQRWAVSGYVRNVFDTFYLTSLLSPVLGTAGDPREFGLGVEFRL